jgi:hypothetical protein
VTMQPLPALPAFIEYRVSNQIVWHGYDSDKHEIIEEITDQPIVNKLLAVSRIQSITEKYVLVSSEYGRYAYWQYHDGYEKLKQRLQQAGLLLQSE